MSDIPQNGPDEVAREGASTAAYDFEQARASVSETQRSIREQQRRQRRVRISLTTGLIIEALALLVWHLTLLPDSPIRIRLPLLIAIDCVAALAAVTILVLGARSLSKQTEQVGSLQKRLAQFRTAERDAKSRMPIGNDRLLWTYHSDILETIDDYREDSLRYRRIHNRFQNVILIGSITTTLTTTVSLKFDFVDWIAILVSFAVGVSATVTGYYKFRERSMNLQQAADDLEQEHKAAELGIRAYRRVPESERLVDFAERAEGIKDLQRKREQQLEQPPDGGEPTPGGASNQA